MAPRARQIAVQACPNCQLEHDVSVYVSGQRLLCKCGLHFEVKRSDRQGARHTSLPDNVVPLRPAASTPEEEAPDFAQTFIARAAQISIPGYELLEILGRGGMGEVWRARQVSLERTVAVKVLPPKLAGDPEFVARFEKEATALATLSHPNIIQIIDRGVAGEHYYFVMEYVEGRSLREILDGGRASPEAALRIVIQICRAIDYAHEKQIIHRDLKPENILLDARGHVKVADFGLAGIGGPTSKHQLTQTRVAMGTINYMAPEQRRDAKHADGRADLYSLGVILYELLTGELPLGRFKLPSEKVPGLDQRLDLVVTQALETELEARYQRASMICAALEEVGGSSVADPPSAPTQPAIPSAKGGSGAADSVVGKGFRGLKVGLMVIGALTAVGFLLKLLPGKASERDSLAVTIGGKKLEISLDSHGHQPGKSPPDTEGELFVSSTYREEPGSGRAKLSLGFEPGEEELNAHSGSWEIREGVLSVVQAGNEPGEAERLRLIPRAYLAHRYFSTDDFTAEVEMRLRELEPDFPLEDDAQHFAELALRIKDLQVSLFAIPGAGMRLMWRYFTPDGLERADNSARDIENMVEDEVSVPRGKFRVKLALKRVRSGVDVSAYANGQRFAHKVLPGLEGQTGKVALGCRNLHCDFDDLVVSGKPMPRPGRKE